MKDLIRTLLVNRIFEAMGNNRFTFNKNKNKTVISLYSDLGLIGDIELERNGDLITINQLEILKSFRGQGFAKKLVIKAINHIKNIGDINKIILEPEPMDTDGLGKNELYTFYSKFGFVDTKDGKMVLDLNHKLNEIEDKTIKCINCGWSWKESTSEPDDLYNCHKCGYNNTPKNINEGILKSELTNIEDDGLYDSLEKQADELRKNSEISFGSADPFEILYNDETGELVGATWIETSGAFSPHMIIKPKYRKMRLSKTLIDGVVEKYKKMKHIRGDEYIFMLNVVNMGLVNTMEKYYGFKILNRDHNGNITMTL